MNSRIWKKLLAIAVLTLCALAAATAAQPNVVIFLADDSGWGDCSFTGNTNLRRISSIW